MIWTLNRTTLGFITAISLVLVGVLGGGLVAVVVQDWRPEPPRPAAIVERVQIGGQPSAASGDSIVHVVVDAHELSKYFKIAAARVRTSVVYIQVEVADSDEDTEGWRFFRDGHPRQSVGSGVIISDAGFIVTNYHVVAGASSLVVTLADKRQFQAEIVGTDPSTDLAVLRIAADDPLPAVSLGDSDLVEVGEWVLAVGNPFRLTSTVTAGIVSALGRQVNIIGDSFGIEDFIQTDAAINPGNSGGALVDLQGNLIGVNTAIATESGSYEGYGFAVPANLVERVVSDLIAYGEVQRGYLGVEIRPVNAGLAGRMGLSEVQGVYLERVWDGGAADRAGLRLGDVVLTVDGHAVSEPNQLQSAIARQRPGDLVTIEVWRRGSLRTYRVKLMGREDPATRTWFADLNGGAEPEPGDESADSFRHHWEDPELEVAHLEEVGLGLRDLRSTEEDEFGIESGAYIAYVERAGLAANSGLRRDMVITRVDDVVVESAEQAVAVLGEMTDQERQTLVEVVRTDGIRAFYQLSASK